MRIFKLSPRRAIAVTAVAVALAATPAVAMASLAAPARPSSAVPGCTAPGLVVWLDSHGQGGGQNMFYNLKFTNLSGHACSLFGFPGVSAVNLAAGQIGVPAQRAPMKPHLVTLRPGGTTTALLQVSITADIPPALCRPVTAAGLRVYPPNSFTSKIVPFPFGACTSKSTGFLTVNPAGK
jgi:hypothetical protein